MGDASTAIVKVTPISGCRQEFAPSCYLLEIDQSRILLDVGGNSTFNAEHLVTLKKLTKTLDVILLSHGDLQHCGALPQLLAEMDVSCPVLATVPVHHLGLVTLYDAFQSHYQATGTAPTQVTLDDIDSAFERVTVLRYSQTFTVAGGIQVTPIAAGHTLGGALWRVRKHTEEIFYAVDFNHKREAHLDGAALELVQRPALLIADTKGALEVHPARRQRDSELVDAMMPALKVGGMALLAVDTAGRALEVLQVIEAHWTAAKLSFPVLFLSHQSQRVVDLAKGMLEWMSGTLAKVFEQDRTNPFDLRNIRIIHKVEEVLAVKGPKVVLASQADLQTGFARVLLSEVLGSSSSCIIFTTKSEGDSLAGQILSSSKGAIIPLTYAEQVPLSGDELQRYRQSEREAAERRAAEAAFAQLQREREDESGVESDEEAVDGATQPARMEQEISSAAALQHYFWADYRSDWYAESDAMATKLVSDPANSPFYPMVPPGAPLGPEGVPVRYQVFPLKEIRRVGDVYGETVDPSEFTRSKFTGRSPIEAVVPSAPTSPPSSLIQTIAPIPVETTEVGPPMKWVIISKDVPVKCSRRFIDVSGISDGRSLKTIYARIQPRRLLLVGGSVEATEYMLNHFTQQQGRSMEVLAPHLGETVTVSSALNVMQAVLSEALIAQLPFRILGDYELAWVRGRVSNPNMDVDKDEEEDEEEGELIAKRAKSMVVLTALEDEAMARPLLLGDPKLSEIRRIVQSELGLSAVFIDGDLVCGSGERRVAIRRETSGLTVEGPLCAEYYSVRSALYATTAAFFQ
jgi:cleavage and polyadenylation specificity factor subunit 2